MTKKAQTKITAKAASDNDNHVNDNFAITGLAPEPLLPLNTSHHASHSGTTLSLFEGDCLSLFSSIPDHSVDLICADPPYGTTLAKWDKVIDFERFWPEIRRILKPTGVCLIFSAQPFTTRLIASSPRNYYRNVWYWKKSRATAPFTTGTQPLRCIEEICVFGRTPRKATYNPQKVARETPIIRKKARTAGKLYKKTPWSREPDGEFISTHAHPTHLLEFPSVGKQLVSTQKPVELLRYLLRTYSHAGDVVLDPTMGSGSTGIACLDEGRNFIGFEMNAEHFEKARNRIAAAVSEAKATDRNLAA